MTVRMLVPVLLLLSFTAFAKPLSLNDAIDTALRESPILAAERQREHIVDLEMRNRSNAFYPKLGLESSHGLGQTNTALSSDPWISSAQLKLTEKLYDNGESLTRFHQGKVDREVARLSYEKTRDSLILQLTEKFYSYSKAVLVLEAVNAQKDVIEKQSQAVTAKYKQGLRTKRDYLRFKAQAQRMQIDARAAVNLRDKALLEVRRLTGLSAEAFEGIEPLKPEAIAVQSMTSRPELAGTYELKIAKAAANSKQFEVDLASRKLWPELSLVSGAYYRNDSYLKSGKGLRDTEGYGWNVLLQLQYKIWDWGELHREREKTEASKLVADHETRKVELDVGAEVQQLMNDLRDGKENLAVTEELLAAQAEAHEVIRRDYSEGRADYNDFVVSLADLLSAKTSYYQTRFDLGTLLAKRKYFEGTLYGEKKS